MKTVHLSMVLSFALCTNALSQEVARMTRSEAIVAIENAADNPQGRGLAAALALEQLLTTGDAGAWSRLRPVLESESADLAIRVLLLDAFARKADGPIAHEMLRMAMDWSKGNRREGAWDQERAAQSISLSSVPLLSRFVQRLAEPPLRDLIGHSDDAIQLLREVALGSGGTLESRNAALTALAESPAPPDRLARIAVDVVLSAKGSQTVDTRTAQLLQRSEAPVLREALAQSGGTAATVHWGAMAALAHLGDTESRELLRAKQAQLEKADPQQAQMVRYYLWQIDVQNPPEKLLEHIAAPDDLTVPHDRSWAMRRALERGLPKADIRRAVLAYAETVAPERRRDAWGRWRTVRPGLGPVKARAVELGILTPDDLPDVPYSDRKPTP